METIIHKDIKRITTEKKYDIHVFDCFIYAKYNGYNSPVNAHIGVISKGSFYYIIQWSKENGALIMTTKKVKSSCLNRIPFENFINIYREWKFISRTDFINAYRKVLNDEMIMLEM